MPDDRRHRVEMLLKIRRRQEDDARRAFDQVRSREEFHRRRIAELETAMAEHDRAARKGLAAGPDAGAAAAYRAAVADVRAAIGENRALLRPLEAMVRKGRAELLDAVGQRRAAEALRDRLLGIHAAGLDRSEALHVDDTHAARLTAAEQAPG